MLDDRTLSILDKYWASHLGCQPEQLFAEPLHILTHGLQLADYNGVFALFRDGGGVVSIPPDRSETLRRLLSGLMHDGSPARLASALSSVAAEIIGEAYLGHATQVSQPRLHPVRELGPADTAALSALQAACGERDWEHGGVSGERPASGSFANGELVAVASYEDWAGTIAHICVITHPDFRSRGFGRSAVAHLSERAIRMGLLPQYRTLETNRGSMRIAEVLGFQRYATSIAVRLQPQLQGARSGHL